ncbi:MAG: saccharopine dehydrogenase NADP-binding domain-containing protein [Actinomycetota bacterium]
MVDDRPFDIGVLGATGVTGTQAVRYLAERLDGTMVRWCLGGRDRARVESIRDRFGAEVACTTVDVTNAASLRTFVESVGTVINLVGPYARFGDAVHDACINAGTHQVDACGEIDWLRQRIQGHDEHARGRGVRLVHTAGFESLPFDLGTRRLAEHFVSRGGSLVKIDVAIRVRRDPPILATGDLISGGTLVSGADAIRRGATAAMHDARILDVQDHAPLPYDLAPRRHLGTGAWLGPMIPSPHINPAIAHRTERLLRDTGYFHRDFRFQEGLVADELVPGLPGALSASWMAGVQAWTNAIAGAPPAIRNAAADAAELLGPRQGAGPDDARLAGWTWTLDFNAVGDDRTTAQLRARGLGHPGYRSSANYVAEMGVALHEDHDPQHFGYLTPALASPAIERFEGAGLVFEPIRTS